VDQVNYIVQKAWKALHFVMRVLKTGNRNTKSLAHTSLVRPILEYGAACWDPCTAGQINASDRVQMKPFNLLIIRRNATGKPSAKRSTIARLCALFKAYSLEWAWKDTRDRLRRPYYLSRVDHVRKIRDGKQRTDIEKYSFVNRTLKNWNQLPAEMLGTFPFKPKFLERELGKQL